MSSVAKNAQLLQNFLKQSMPSELRILVNGANGWLGKNISESLFEIFQDRFNENVLLTGSKAGLLLLQNGRKLQVTQWSEAVIKEFEPTHVIQLAFKTRDHVFDMSIEDYLVVNEEIINRAIWMIAMPSLRGFMHTSSGAAIGSSITEKLSDPYGYLKKLEEDQYAGKCAEHHKQYLGLRVWSTTGRYIKTGGIFAVESLISQALSTGDVHINSSGEVWRSYADAKEILLAALIALFMGESGMYNSGGRDIEIGALAELVASAMQVPKTKIVRPLSKFSASSIYKSMEPSIENFLVANNLTYSNLEDQVSNTMEYLVWLNSQAKYR